MIKRVLLLIAVLISIIGLYLQINPYTLLKIDMLIILIVLAIALAPFSFGCMPSPFTPFFALIVAAIILLLFSFFYIPNISSQTQTCTSIIMNENGTIIQNITIPCP